MFRKKKGTKNGVNWIIDERKHDPVIITVCKISTGESESIVHNCIYPPIFGYDVLDCELIEEKLDELIEKYSEV